MAWSTREVADLAGTTVNAVRHYHNTGLLDEPERLPNGYKQYQVSHLVRLLQIRRLRDVGVPLAQIEAVGSGDGDGPASALLLIDADLTASIERLQRARAEIRAIVESGTTVDVPAGFEDVAAKLTASDRSLVLVYSQLYDESAMADLKRMVEAEPDDAGDEFEALAPEADDATRQRVAEAMAAQFVRHLTDYPWLSEPEPHLSRTPKVTRETFTEAVLHLYNDAQLDVIARASILATRQRDAADRPADEAPPSV